MASLVVRNAVRIVRRTPAIAAFRPYSDEVPYVNPHRAKNVSDTVDMPDGLGHSVGPDRFERLSKLAGNEDPFEMNIKKRASGTLEDPTLISSAYQQRIVGCICEEDALSISWMELKMGEPKRCQCGFWFQLQDLKFEDYGQA